MSASMAWVGTSIPGRGREHQDHLVGPMLANEEASAMASVVGLEVMEGGGIKTTMQYQY